MNLLQLLALMDSLLLPFAWKRVQSEAAHTRSAAHPDWTLVCAVFGVLAFPSGETTLPVIWLPVPTAARPLSGAALTPASSAGVSTHFPEWLRSQITTQPVFQSKKLSCGGRGGGSKRGHGCTSNFGFDKQKRSKHRHSSSSCRGFMVKYLISISSAVATQQALALCPWQQQGT